MIELRQTQDFADWLGSLKDKATRARIAARVQRLAFGHFGDVRPVGEGISELRIHFGPGWRVYFVQRGPVLIVLLCVKGGAWAGYLLQKAGLIFPVSMGGMLVGVIVRNLHDAAGGRLIDSTFKR